MKAMNWQNLESAFPFSYVNQGKMEDRLFTLARQYSPYGARYDGGQWYAIKVKHYTVCIPTQGNYTVYNPLNGWEGEMDAATYGAALLLLMTNHDLWKRYEAGMDVESMGDFWHGLRNAIYDDQRFDTGALIGFLD
jgi:hypothetical protein